MKVLFRPYGLFFIAGILLLVLSFFVSGKTTDFHIHDTYFVTGFEFVFWVLSFISFLFWILYKLTFRFLLSHFLTWLHIVITIVAPVIISMILMQPAAAYQSKKGYATFAEIENYQKPGKMVALITITLLVGQVVYVINFVAGLVKRNFAR